MHEEREDEIEETEEISLEDTQEYRVTGTGGDEGFDDDAGTGGAGQPDDDYDEYEDDDEPGFEGDFDEDEYYDDEPVDSEIDDGRPVEDEGQVEEDPTEGSVSGHLKAACVAALARVRSIELPEIPKPRLPNRPGWSERTTAEGGKDEPSAGIGASHPAVVIAVIVIVSLAVGVGTYFLGKGSGDDVDTARLEGAAAGKQAGAIEGAAKGYSAGFQKGRKAGFDKAYIPAYKLNYKRAFEQAGLDVPTDKEIDIPKP